jgi:hypothetical protein
VSETLPKPTHSKSKEEIAFDIYNELKEENIIPDE